MAKIKCSSCKEEVVNQRGTVKFMCPKCGKMEIVRCPHCKRIAAKYRCASCGFEGPN